MLLSIEETIENLVQKSAGSEIVDYETYLAPYITKEIEKSQFEEMLSEVEKRIPIYKQFHDPTAFGLDDAEFRQAQNNAKKAFSKKLAKPIAIFNYLVYTIVSGFVCITSFVCFIQTAKFAAFSLIPYISIIIFLVSLFSLFMIQGLWLPDLFNNHSSRLQGGFGRKIIHFFTKKKRLQILKIEIAYAMKDKYYS
jgi:hypothetical protein